MLTTLSTAFKVSPPTRSPQEDAADVLRVESAAVSLTDASSHVQRAESAAIAVGHADDLLLRRRFHGLVFLLGSTTAALDRTLPFNRTRCLKPRGDSEVAWAFLNSSY